MHYGSIGSIDPIHPIWVVWDPWIQSIGTPWEVRIDGIQAQASQMATPWDVPEWVIL